MMLIDFFYLNGRQLFRRQYISSTSIISKLSFLGNYLSVKCTVGKIIFDEINRTHLNSGRIPVIRCHRRNNNHRRGESGSSSNNGQLSSNISKSEIKKNYKKNSPSRLHYSTSDIWSCVVYCLCKTRTWNINCDQTLFFHRFSLCLTQTSAVQNMFTK